jgi:putative SOS response-associated peptidase YedK
VLALTRPCPEEWLRMYAVSKRVNKVANDDAGVLVDASEGVVEVKEGGGGGQGELF